MLGWYHRIGRGCRGGRCDPSGIGWFGRTRSGGVASLDHRLMASTLSGSFGVGFELFSSGRHSGSLGSRRLLRGIDPV